MSPARLPVLLVPALVGCLPQPEPTLRLGFTVAEPGEGLVASSAVWDLEGVRLRGCEEAVAASLGWPGVPDEAQTFTPRAGPQPYTDGLVGAPDLLTSRQNDLPLGPWCAFEVVVAGPLRWVGETDDGDEVVLRLQLPDLALAEAVPFGDGEEADPLVVHLGGGGWASPLATRLGGSLSVDPTDPDHEELVDRLLSEAGMWVDADDDGTLSEEELAAGPLVGLVRHGG